MGKLHFQLQNILCLFVLLHALAVLPLSSSAYTPECQYCINCGSFSSIALDGRTFLGDRNSNSDFSPGISEDVEGSNSLADTSSLYQTARIYRRASSFDFNIKVNGTYLVRLHFFPFNSKGFNLVDALFNVSTPDFSLLPNFSVLSSRQLPVIKEFYLSVNVSKFDIYFIPVGKSFAFINAIEIILLPANFTPDLANKIYPSDVERVLHIPLPSSSLQTLYRINVGGQEVSDALWRKWVPDDSYLIVKDSAKNCTPKNVAAAADDVVPNQVYGTCREVVNGSGGTNSPNITWRFDVGKNASYLVRTYFRDIVSDSPGLLFDISIYFRFQINITSLAIPIPFDFLVDSDDSGYMNISIGLSQKSYEKHAFLNGLEIMEFVKKNNMKLPLPSEETHKKSPILIIGLVVGVVSISILILIALLCLKFRKSKPVKVLVPKSEGKGRSTSWKAERIGNNSPVPNLNLKLKIPFTEILAATQNFDTTLLIGQGGFGKVYKGMLLNGMKVAVKRSDSSHGQGLFEFQTEVIVLSKIRHRHLLSLIGYCDDRSEMILVYEFMEKGTLRDHLYNWKENFEMPSTKSELNWKQRLEICIGSAKGLYYLHTGSDGGIIHRDVKSTNILLDEHYIAKVADFGLSQSGIPDSDHFSMGVKGSFGYHDPEYFRTFQLTHKSDVYSFGVVLLEVLCARLPIVDSTCREERNLAEWFLFNQKNGELEKIIDPSLKGHVNSNSLRKFCEIAEKCLKPEGADRPTMLDVCWDLEYALQLQQTAVHKEPYEDTVTDVSSNMLSPVVQKFSSSSFPAAEDDDDMETTTASAVFSQLKIYGAR